MQKVFTSNKIEKAKCQNALRIKGLWHFFTSNILLQKTRFSKCQKHFWTEKSEIFARKLKKQNKTGYKKPLKTLGFSRVKWRRKRDSNPRAFWANGFQEVYQRIPFQLSSVQFRLKRFAKILILQGFSGLFGTDMN